MTIFFCNIFVNKYSLILLKEFHTHKFGIFVLIFISAQDLKTAEKERQKRIATLEKEVVNILNGMAAVVYRTFVRYHWKLLWACFAPLSETARFCEPIFIVLRSWDFSVNTWRQFCNVYCMYCSRFTTWFLFKLFGRLLTSIQIHKGQIDILREASQVSCLISCNHWSYLLKLSNCCLQTLFKLSVAHVRGQLWFLIGWSGYRPVFGHTVEGITKGIAWGCWCTHFPPPPSPPHMRTY